MRTHKEAKERMLDRRDREPRTKGKSPPLAYADIDPKRLTRAVPEGLIEDTEAVRSERRIERREEIAEEVDTSFDIDVGREDVLGAIRDVNDIELDVLDEEGLLQVVAESNRLTSSILNVMLENQIDMLLELDDIRSAVEPHYNLNVSGVATTEQPDEPVPVIPESDERTFNVRRLFLRCMPYNKYPIYFGDDGVSPESGFMLRPGEYIILHIDFRDEQIYMASEEPGQDVGLMGVY